MAACLECPNPLLQDRAAISRVAVGVILIAIVSLAGVGYGVASLGQTPTSQTGQHTVTEQTTQTATFINYITTSITQTTTLTSTVISTLPRAGLQLEVILNSTTMQYGSGVTVTIGLFNSLLTNLTMNVNYSNYQSTLAWNSQDFLCSLTPVYDLFGFGLYQGYYTSGNISSARSNSLLLTPSAAVPCPTAYQPNFSSVTFQSQSYSATLSSGSYSLTTSMMFNATTEGCHRASSSAFSCGAGNSLFGYWTKPPQNVSCSQLPTANETSPAILIGPYCDLVSFPVGSYTLVAQDVWNQTIFAHFQVVAIGNTSTRHVVTFQQIGACNEKFWGIPWSVTIGSLTLVQPPNTPLPLDNSTLYSTSNLNYTRITFSLPDGVYSFSVSPSNYFFTPTIGTVTVSGSNVTVPVAYTGTSCTTTQTT